MKLILCLSFLFLPLFLIAQNFSNEESDSIIKVLDFHELKMKRGDLNSLRFLGQLLDDTTTMRIESNSRRCWGCRYLPRVKEEAYERMENYTVFKKIEFSEATSAPEFLSFLDNQGKNIRFSYFINRFIDTDLEQHNVQYRLTAALPNPSEMTIDETRTFIKNKLKERKPNGVYAAIDAIARIKTLQTQLDFYENMGSYKAIIGINEDFVSNHYYTKDLLIALSKFTNYCQDNNITYRPSESLEAAFQSLVSDTLTSINRYQLENKLANTLTFEEVNALEWLIVIHEKSKLLIKSSQRILDIWYMKNWKTVISNQKNMIWYIKKTTWINQFTDYVYINRWKNSAVSVYETLKNIHDTTDDRELQFALREILPKKYISNFLSLSDVFNHLDQIDLKDLENLRFDLNTPKEYDFIFQQLAKHQGKDTLLFIFNILSDNLKPALTPYLLSFLDNHRIIFSYLGHSNYYFYNPEHLTTISDKINYIILHFHLMMLV